MKKFRIVLCLLILLCILLNCVGCNFKTKYSVFSDDDHIITNISSSIRDYISIVIDNRELVVCSYEGREICRKRCEKRIVSVDMYNDKVLLQFEDDSIELYQIADGNLILSIQKAFPSPIKKSEIVGWIDDYTGIVVLLENGDLFSSENPDAPNDIVKIDTHVKAEAALLEFYIYTREDGAVIKMLRGSVYSPAPEIDMRLARDIVELRLARFNGDYGFLGIGTDQVYYLRGIPLCYDAEIDLSEIDIDSVKSGKYMYSSVLYQENGQWYYEGIKKDYVHDINYAHRKKIRVNQGESVLPIPGGVIFYTEHEVRAQLI